MRYVWAVVAFVLAAILIGAGVAQRTLFVGPPNIQADIAVEQSEPFVLLDGDVLRANPGAQTLLVRGAGEIFVAYGRTADLEAWLSDATYNSVALAKNEKPVTTVVEPTVVNDAEDAAPAEGDAATDDAAAAEAATDDAATEVVTAGRNPAGSDLWLDSFSETDALITPLQLPEGMSVLIARDGTEDAPEDIVISWPLDNSTPWAGPLIAAGFVALLAGLVLYFLGILHQRRGRGPRRKGPGPLPPTEPIDISELSAAEAKALGSSVPAQVAPAEDAPADGDVVVAEIVDEQEPVDDAGKNQSGTSPMMATTTARRRRVLALPVIALTAVLATGCSAESWPQFGATPSPSPSATVITPENQKPPAVTEAQAMRILQKISSTLVDADEALDITLAATRLDGTALAARTTEYALRTALPETPLPAVIPVDKVEVLLPQATDTWPRTVLMLSQTSGDDTVPPVIFTMTQTDPWSEYKVSNIAEMQASAQFPELAASWLGTSLVPAESAFLSLAPGKLGEAFADVVDQGDASASFGLFDELSIKLVTSIRDSRQAVVQTLADNGAAETSTAAFDMTVTEAAPVAMTTLDSGAIVSVSLLDTETVTPASDDAVIRFGENAQAKALTGVAESAKGVETTYAFQLFFAVPTQGSTEQIRLLAVHQDILGVKVIK